jgi:hypothetical protein
MLLSAKIAEAKITTTFSLLLRRDCAPRTSKADRQYILLQSHELLHPEPAKPSVCCLYYLQMTIIRHMRSGIL